MTFSSTEDIDCTIGVSRDRDKIRSILEDCLSDDDFFCRKGRLLLRQLGIPQGDDLILLARHKSKVKYGYVLASDTVSHILDLAGKKEKQSLQRLVESPFFLVKASWLYEHAPSFFFFDKGKAADLDDFIVRFADEYEAGLLENRVSIDGWEKVRNPHRVMGVTFWENQIFDPVALVDKMRCEKIEGLELSVDFHPFNYKKLLPEEFSPEKRALIKEAVCKAGLKLDIHSPIVGPYAPLPNPKKGQQLFFDPLKCPAVQSETIRLACDIGARSVVFHLIDHKRMKDMAALVKKAEGTPVRVTFENYCQIDGVQNSAMFVACLDEIIGFLPEDVKRRNFGVTLDVGHLNVEGEDPLAGAERIGLWCLAHDVFLRLHATDNYGKLLFSPPAYSADVHANVSGRGINSALIITLLRSLGHEFDVVAEQIQPLSPRDIALIHKAQTASVDEPYESIVARGKDRLANWGFEPLIPSSISSKNVYRFLAGLAGISGLKEYLVLRRIQDQKYLSVDEARKISQDFMKMPLKFRNNLTEYIDEMILPVQSEHGVLQKSEIDLICQNISGALFGTINNEHLDRIFSEVRSYRKGETICEQNAVGREMYYIRSGEVAVFLGENQLAALKPGEIFGEISLFYNVARTATIRAAADITEVGVLTRSGFETILQDSHPYSHDLIYRLYSILPDRLRNLNEKYRMAINALSLLTEGRERKMRIGEGVDAILKPKENFFPTITGEEARLLFTETKFFDAGRTVITEGDFAEGAYLILEGKAKAVISSDGGEKIVLGEFDRGEIFGEMALIDNKPRSASVVTVTPCELAFMEKGAFGRIIEPLSSLSFRLMAFICLSIFRRIIALDKEYADLKKMLGKKNPGNKEQTR
ncbi:MAG: cAMP-activated global transcriptional regulator CRP [Smithella sp. PtaU1.Bin162]|nr:MAG: cAMP-activated global transcriptional regulator CRP [Smithella sp. PtaU1.Bin162]